MQCDMCGAKETLYKTLVEGVELSVCSNCSKLGKVIRKAKSNQEIKQEHVFAKEYLEKKRLKPLEKQERIVFNYAEIIRNKRAEMGLKQEELARRLNEKASLMQKVESGAFAPPIKLARKLEKNLGVKLIEDDKKLDVKLDNTKSEGFTLGDAIKFKK